jgi:cytochrome c-type biogenesis protein CcsB
MTDTLSQLSVLSIYSAMGVYALAFVAFALDLAWRGATDNVPAAALRNVTRQAKIDQSADGDVVRTRTVTLPRVSNRAGGGVEHSPTSRSLRVAFALTVLGFVLHLAGVVLRGVAADRVPWANMWEFSITGTLIIVGVFLVVNLRYDLRFLGVFVIGLSLIFLGIAAVRYYVDVVPLQPALQSYWLVIHVIVAIIATGFFALGFALSGVQILQTRRERIAESAKNPKLRFLTTLPPSEKLENLAYRLNIVGFILWTFTLMAGSIWAEKAWGRYWGWDTKEVWTFIIWVLYAGYIHARATRGWRGSRSTWLAIVGFAAVMFNFGIVNVFFNGLHSYSGL